MSNRPSMEARTDVGLKSFHLFFIGACVILAAFVAAWATGQYRAAGDAGYIATAVASTLAAAALAVYAAKFQRKMRGL